MPALQESQQRTIFTRFHESAVKQNQENKNRLDAFFENPQIGEMLSLCDSNKRWQNFNRLWKQHDGLKKRAKIGDYETEILNPRNFLAHGKPELYREGGYLFVHRGNRFLFNDETSLILRQTILRYKVAFSEILETITNGQ